jgi:putative ATP-dependent endonuclease of OLD family
MKLTHIKISNFRSFVGEHEFHLADGVNYFVGPNNCGKSNLIAALELAMDPNRSFVPERDRPAMLQGSTKTRITLTFTQTGRGDGPEKTLLDRARKYELALRRRQKRETARKGTTFAEDGTLNRVVTFGGQGARQVSFQAKGLGAVSLPIDSPEHVQLEDQFIKVMRFGVVHSGEDLESVLQGKFREVLQLVINDHLAAELAETSELRQKYIDGLRTVLLGPLRDRVQDRVSTLFPEIKVVDLIPDVPSLAETLSAVGVEMSDTASTELKDKGTGVRGAVLIAMLQYLAEQSKRSLVLAVEEPEAFLHPAAQEAAGEQLESLAERPEVTLMITTHSPYVVARSPQALITELQKSAEGTTSVAATARGDENRADLLGSLFTDKGFARVIERAISIPQGTRAVVVTEGYTDSLFLSLGLEAAGRLDLLDGIHFINAGGAKKVVLQSILASSATEVPVIALLDQDPHGKSAEETLGDFGWRKDEQILSLSSWYGRCTRCGHDVEIEDLLPPAAVAKISSFVGDVAYDTMTRCGSKRHYRLSKAWKDAAIRMLPRELKADDEGGMIWLGEEINRRIEKVVARQEKSQLFAK